MSEKKATHLAAHQFQKGRSGNPGGRAKGHERRLRECVEAMRADDPMPDPEAPAGQKIPAFEAIVKQAVLDAVAGDRYARDFIADRLMGKAKQTVAFTDAEMESDDESDLEGLDLDELRVLAKVHAARQRTDVH